jgi:sugar lactone lactonase YvrE
MCYNVAVSTSMRIEPPDDQRPLRRYGREEPDLVLSIAHWIRPGSPTRLPPIVVQSTVAALEEQGAFLMKTFVSHRPTVRVTVIALLLFLLPAVLAYGAGENKMYWTEFGVPTIWRANLDDGSGAEQLIRRVDPLILALDLSAQKIYWTDVSNAEVLRSDFDGSNTDTLFAGLVGGMALDVAGGKMYLADPYGGRIYWANLDGTGQENLIEGLTYPVGVALDISGGKMYWTDAIEGTIRRANLNGTGPEVLVPGLVSPLDIDLDTARGKMYWSDPSTGKIQRANLDGTSPEDVTTSTNPAGLALELTSQLLYWTDVSDRKVRRVTFDGTNPEDLVDTPAVGSPAMIALDSARGKMYWSDPDFHTVHRADLDGSLAEQVITGVANPSGMTLDLKADKMYWADTFKGTISRSNLDGTGGETVIEQVGEPVDVAVDTTDGRIYWTENISGEIWSVDSNGTNADVVIEDYLARYLALDVVGRQLYWTDLGGMILRATEGSTAIDTLLTGLIDPAGIALDIAGGKMYWTDTSENNIQRANLDGSAREELRPGLGTPTAIALDVKAGKMYWTELDAGVVRRANLDGTNQEDMATGIDQPWGLALDPGPFSPTLLQSFAAVPFQSGIEIEWRLSEAGAEMRFVVLRAPVSRDGSEREAYRELDGVTVVGTGLAYRATDAGCRPGETYRYRIDVSDEDGRRVLFETGAITVPVVVAELRQNHPNPFNPSTVIAFVLPKRAHATLAVYDARGALVRTLVDGMLDHGLREVTWDGRDAKGRAVSSGVYFYRLQVEKTVLTKKMILLK